MHVWLQAWINPKQENHQPEEDCDFQPNFLRYKKLGAGKSAKYS